MKHPHVRVSLLWKIQRRSGLDVGPRSGTQETARNVGTVAKLRGIVARDPGIDGGSTEPLPADNWPDSWS